LAPLPSTFDAAGPTSETSIAEGAALDRRSAMSDAGGLVLSLIVAVAALRTGITGPDPARANVPIAKHRDPIVKVRRHTVTVHRPGSTSGGTTGTVVTIVPSPVAMNDRSDPGSGANEGSGGVSLTPAPGGAGSGGDDGGLDNGGWPNGSGSPSSSPTWSGDD